MQKSHAVFFSKMSYFMGKYDKKCRKKIFWQVFQYLGMKGLNSLEKYSSCV